MRGVFVGVLAGAAALTASASSAAEAPSSPAQRVIDCRGESDPARRLACYDAAAGQLANAVGKGEVTVVTRDEVRKTRRALFGLSLPRLAIFDRNRAVDEPEPQEIESKVRSVSAESNNRFVVTLEDGAVWRTTEAVMRTPKVGAEVRIKRGAMGSYFMTIRGARSVRAARVV